MRFYLLVLCTVANATVLKWRVQLHCRTGAYVLGLRTLVLQTDSIDETCDAQVWLYHSHTDEVADTYAGLVGALVITKRGMATSEGKPSDVDSEVFTFFQVNDENSRCLPQLCCLCCWNSLCVEEDVCSVVELASMH